MTTKKMSKEQSAAAAAKYHAAKNAHEQVATAFAATRNGGSKIGAERLKQIELERAHLTAEDELRAATLGYQLALHASELAAGDVDAWAVDLPSIAADCGDLETQAMALDVQAAELRRRAAARIHEQGFAAQERIAARRSAAGEPPPLPIPPAGHPRGVATQVHLAAIEKVLADGHKVTKSNVDRIGKLEREAIEIRAQLERQIREAEERRRENEQIAAQQERERKADAERQGREWAEQHTRGVKQIGELAEAYKRRQAQGDNPTP